MNEVTKYAIGGIIIGAAITYVFLKRNQGPAMSTKLKEAEDNGYNQAHDEAIEFIKQHIPYQSSAGQLYEKLMAAKA